MAGTTDSDLRASAEQNLDAAQALLGESVAPSAVSGDYWSDLADRAKVLLKKAYNVHLDAGSKAAAKIRDAVKLGLDKASEASATARGALAGVALGAGALALAPLLLPLAAFLLIERSGWGGRARRAGRRYVSQRARAHGF